MTQKPKEKFEAMFERMKKEAHGTISTEGMHSCRICWAFNDFKKDLLTFIDENTVEVVTLKKQGDRKPGFLFEAVPVSVFGTKKGETK